MVAQQPFYVRTSHFYRVCWGTEEVYPEITSKPTVKDTELAKTDPELANMLCNYTAFDGASFD